MNSHDEQWWVLQAGEYVLGTLPATERATFEKLLEHDVDAREYVTWWEERLAHLDTSAERITPPLHVWQSITERLDFDAVKGTAADTADVTPEEPGSAQSRPDITHLPLNQHSALGRRVTLWRGLTGLATAASLLLGFMLWQGGELPSAAPPSAFNVISVVSSDTAPALWVIDAAPEAKQLRVTAVAPPEIEAGKAFQLWVVKPEEQGVASMGLLPVKAGQSIMLNAPGLVHNGIAFAVSLEPEGGSPEPTPSGPVLYQGNIQKVSNPASIKL